MMDPRIRVTAEEIDAAEETDHDWSQLRELLTTPTVFDAVDNQHA